MKWVLPRPMQLDNEQLSRYISKHKYSFTKKRHTHGSYKDSIIILKDSEVEELQFHTI